MIDATANVGMQTELTPHQLAVFQGEYARRRKSLFVGYLWWFFLAGLGAHLFYYNRKNAAWVRMALIIGGGVSAPIIIGFVPLILGCILNLVDAFVLPRMNAEENSHLEVVLASKIKPSL